ncbi:C45 family autoproteolytic acyltransferase/hydolase [Kiloniella laminariae]|uniref:C45 family autoproteolytic acyltransferase/hydolase n=1 Tax=Kiloniella laminariae TaxID=454162 RepID=UPI00037277C2|nr:C45 family peptidase [Kiloniella laminariae]
MDLVFEKLYETKAGPAWKDLFDRLWPAYEKWFLSEGIAARQTYLAGLRAMKRYMPELVPTYEHLCELAGGGDLAARFLSFYRPPLYLSGCSQAVWLGDEPMLVRNYDYAPELCDGVLLDSAWNGRRVMAISDGMWGVVDGLNDAGLAISLTFGGRRVVGNGFGVPLILRYILEFCDTTKEAIAVLRRIPCHMAYNVTCVDRSGAYVTVYLSPDRDVLVKDTRVATNHQEHVEWHLHARVTATVERERFLLQRLTMHEEPAEKFIGAFLKPPLYSTNFSRGFGTLYTSVYWPLRGGIDIHWPGAVWSHSFAEPTIEKRQIRYPDHVPLY